MELNDWSPAQDKSGGVSALFLFFLSSTSPLNQILQQITLLEEDLNVSLFNQLEYVLKYLNTFVQRRLKIVIQVW